MKELSLKTETREIKFQPDIKTKTLDLIDGETGEILFEFTTKQQVVEFTDNLELFFKTNISILAK